MQDTTQEEFLTRREELAQSRIQQAQQASKPLVNETAQVINEIYPTFKEVKEPLINNHTAQITAANTRPVQTKPVVEGTDTMSNVLRALNDTSLPSKQPLQAGDPFTYMTSRDFLVSFVFASLAFVSLLNVLG